MRYVFFFHHDRILKCFLGHYNSNQMGYNTDSLVTAARGGYFYKSVIEGLEFPMLISDLTLYQ